MKQMILSLLAVASMATGARGADINPFCHFNTKADLAGENLPTNSFHNDGVVKILALAPAQTGSIFLAPGYAVALYAGPAFQGPSTIVKNDGHPPFTSVDGGAYVNVSSLQSPYADLTALSPGFGINSLRCFKLGTKFQNSLGRKSSVTAFYNDQTFEVPMMSAHGTAYYATLTDTNDKPMLKIVEYPSHEAFRAFSIDLSTGAVTIARGAYPAHLQPASTQTYQAKDGLCYIGALATLRNTLKIFGSPNEPAFLMHAAFPELFEVSIQLDAMLGSFQNYPHG